jgi:hypothetical protein
MRDAYDRLIAARDEAVVRLCHWCTRGQAHKDERPCTVFSFEHEEWEQFRLAERRQLDSLVLEFHANEVSAQALFECCLEHVKTFSHDMGKNRVAADLFTEITGLRTLSLNRDASDPPWLVWVRQHFGWWNVPKWGDDSYRSFTARALLINDPMWSAPYVYLERDILEAMLPLKPLQCDECKQDYDSEDDEREWNRYVDVRGANGRERSVEVLTCSKKCRASQRRTIGNQVRALQRAHIALKQTHGVIRQQELLLRCSEYERKQERKKEKQWLQKGKQTLTDIRKLLKKPSDFAAQSTQQTASGRAMTSPR